MVEIKNQSKRNEFLRLRSLGESFDKIADKIGVSKQTLLSWSKFYSEELSQIKSKVLKNVVEEYGIAKAGRLKIIAQDMLRLDTELNKRDFASIPTSKLIQIKLKALEVAGNILDIKRVEVGEPLVVNDAMSRYENILKQCGMIPGGKGAYVSDEIEEE